MQISRITYYIVNYYKHFMHVLQTGIKNTLRIDVRARPVTSYQHCLPPLVNYICINLKFQLHVLVNE